MTSLADLFVLGSLFLSVLLTIQSAYTLYLMTFGSGSVGTCSAASLLSQQTRS